MVSVFIGYKHNVFWFLNTCQSFESCFIPYLKLDENVVLHTELHRKSTSKSNKSSSKLQMVEILEIWNHDCFSYLQCKKQVRVMEFRHLLIYLLIYFVQDMELSPCGDRELVVEKSEEAIGIDIESWVVENEVWLDLSSSRPDQESLVLGHSSKKGRRDWPSCFTASPEANSLLKNECWG